MSDGAQGPGWWVASDGNWYAPEQHPNYQAPLPAPPLPNPPGVSAQQPHYVITSAPPKNRKKKGRVLLMVLAVFAALIVILIATLIIIGVVKGIHSGNSNSSQGGYGASPTALSLGPLVKEGAPAANPW